jgi:hypothetical protein
MNVSYHRAVSYHLDPVYDATKSVLAKIPGGVKRLESAETSRFSGLAIASLYWDPQLSSPRTANFCGPLDFRVRSMR